MTPQRTMTGDWIWQLEGDFRTFVIDEWMNDADMPGPIDAPEHMAAGSMFQRQWRGAEPAGFVTHFRRDG